MKVISVLGRKGGSGKTMVSHFAALGLSLLPFDTVVLQTDLRVERPPDLIPGRRYMLSAVFGNPDAAAAIITETVAATDRIPNSVLVVDGGANRRNLDHLIVGISDIVLIPVGTSDEDVRVAMADYDDLQVHAETIGRTPDVFFVLNRWPNDARRQDVVQRRTWIGKFMTATEDRRFPIIVPDMPSLLDITFGEGPFEPSALIERRAKDFAAMLAIRLGITPRGANEETWYSDWVAKGQSAA